MTNSASVIIVARNASHQFHPPCRLLIPPTCLSRQHPPANNPFPTCRLILRHHQHHHIHSLSKSPQENLSGSIKRLLPEGVEREAKKAKIQAQREKLREIMGMAEEIPKKVTTATRNKDSAEKHSNSLDSIPDMSKLKSPKSSNLLLHQSQSSIPIETTSSNLRKTQKPPRPFQYTAIPQEKNTINHPRKYTVPSNIPKLRGKILAKPGKKSVAQPLKVAPPGFKQSNEQQKESKSYSIITPGNAVLSLALNTIT